MTSSLKVGRLLFARIGWMRFYRGPQPGDPKPVGGGKYNDTGTGGEVFNFLPIGDRLFAYFQPQLQPENRRALHPSSIRLEKIESKTDGDRLEDVLVIFVARNPLVGGQYVVGWFKNAIIYRNRQNSTQKERDETEWYVECHEGDGVLVPSRRRTFSVPGGKGGFGQANICYVYDDCGKEKTSIGWMREAVEYASSYSHENLVNDPSAESSPVIADLIEDTIEQVAGYQSNPRIRVAIEDYAMDWARKRLTSLGFRPTDEHKTMPYDFCCKKDGKELFVEVKGTQDNGRCVSLTPNAVRHAIANENSALFIVHSVHVKGKKGSKYRAARSDL